MTIYNKYILTVAILLSVTTVILIALAQNSLKIYYITYIIEALITTELFIYFSAKAKRSLQPVVSVLFVCFLAVLTLEIINILA